jgi:hypothetical protein
MVQGVTIKKVDDKNVTFTTRSAGAAGNSDQQLRRTFTVPLTEVHAAPIPGEVVPVALTPGAIGTLFLSREGWKATSSDGLGFGIHGAAVAIFKFPDCAGVSTRFLTKLTVIPTSIVIRGHLEDETEFFDIDLLTSEAAESQDLAWNGADYIELQLTESGARRLNVKSPSTTVKVWPTKILVKGSPVIDQAMVGEVDILDGEMAEGVQQFAFAKPGSPITLALTQDGVDAFHVSAQAIAERSSKSSSDLGPAPLPKHSGDAARA